MEEVRNDEKQDHFKFNREIAKSSMSKILSKIFPALMSYGMGEKVSNTNKSNLQRATVPSQQMVTSFGHLNPRPGYHLRC